MTPEDLSEAFHKVFHDIGNPITSIISYSNLIEQAPTLGIPLEKASNYSSSITKEAWKVNRLLELFLLLVSKKNNTSLVSLESCKKNVIARYANRYGLGELDINFINFDQEISFIGESDQVTVIFCEILSNALGAISQMENKEDFLTIDIEHETILDNNSEKFLKINFKNKSKKHNSNLDDLKKIGVCEFSRFNKPAGIGLFAISNTLEKWGGRLEIKEELVNNQEYYFITSLYLAQ